MLSLLHRVSDKNRKSNRSKRDSTQLRVERLENRHVLSAGGLDPSFGGGDGIELVSFAAAGGDERQPVIAFQPIEDAVGQVVEERIIVGGSIASPSVDGLFANRDFFLARFNANGSLDTTFGNNGIVKTDFAGRNDRVTQLLVSNDGKILAIGSANTSKGWIDVGIARYTANGVLDQTFGSGGRVTTQVISGSSVADTASDAILDGDRLIVVGGSNTNKRGSFYHTNFIVRYTANGSLDGTFGKGGKVIGPSGAFSQDAWGEVVKKGNELLVWGRDNRQMTIGRYSDRGAVLGKTLAPLTEGINLSFDPSAQKLVGFRNITSDPVAGDHFELSRFNLNGTRDTTFGGGDGVVVTDFANSTETAASMTLDGQGRLIVVGDIHPNPWPASSDFLVVRYTADGELDQSFGSGGVVTTSIGSADLEFDYLSQVVVQHDGRILVAGATDKWDGEKLVWDYDFALARYLSESESPETSSSAGSSTADFDAALAIFFSEDSTPNKRRKK